MRRALDVISRGLAFWVVLGAAAAYLEPRAFAWTRWPVRAVLAGLPAGWDAAPASPYDLLAQPVATWMFALTMFSVGTVLEGKAFAVVARHPLWVALGILTQFTVMPALGFAVGTRLGFGPDLALGFILVGCAPGAMTSNVLSYLAGGDAAFSVTLTTIASIAAVPVTPSLVGLLAGAELGMTPEKFWEQLGTIAWSVATPLLFGLAVRRLLPSARRAFETASPAVAALAIVAICCFVVQRTRDELAAATIPVFAGVAGVNAAGYALGWILGGAYRFPRPQRVTLAIEIGMQNAGLGVVLASTTFRDRPAVAVPAALFTIWCIVTASGLIALRPAALRARSRSSRSRDEARSPARTPRAPVREAAARRGRGSRAPPPHPSS